jgi:hypothetical protein
MLGPGRASNLRLGLSFSTLPFDEEKAAKVGATRTVIYNPVPPENYIRA